MILRQKISLTAFLVVNPDSNRDIDVIRDVGVGIVANDDVVVIAVVVPVLQFIIIFWCAIEPLIATSFGPNGGQRADDEGGQNGPGCQFVTGH